MKSKFRPIFHFTPTKGYMNDPNGLIYNQRTKEYHLFYQYSEEISYDEYFGSWVEKNWGHAVSHNLIDWEEREIALSHDEIGLIWSGSSTVDRNNDLGVFPENIPQEDRMVCAFACANSNPVNGYGKISCCLAYSFDGGKRWHKCEQNPVIPNEGNKFDEAFGDPKIFWLEDDFYPAGGIWVMITVFKVRIFTSPDLKNWTLQSEGSIHGEPFHSECPDIFPCTVNGVKKWIFSGAGRYYIVGDFTHDENGLLQFVAQSNKIEIKRGNLYATQHFMNMPDDRIVLMSWMGDHSSLDLYEDGKEWDGAQSIPMEFNLHKDGEEYSVTLLPARELLDLRQGVAFQAENATVSGEWRELSALKAQTFDMEAQFDVSDCPYFMLEVRKGGRETTRIFYTQEKKEVEVNTYLSGKVVHEHYHLPVTVENGKLFLRLLVDTTALDLFVNGGKASCSTLFFPKESSQGVSLRAEGTLKVEKFTVYKVRNSLE